MRSVIAIACLMLMPVLIESCILFENECPHTPTDFSIGGFELTTQKDGKQADPSKLTSGTPKSILFAMVLDRQTASIRRSTMGAYADCALAKAFETITDLTIVSGNDLVTTDSTFATGSDLAPVVQLQYDSQGIEDQTLYGSINYNYMPLFRVASAQTHTLTFSIKLSDGRSFELKTGAVEFLPEQ